MEPKAQPTRNQKTKLAVIPVLAVVLAWMLFGNSQKQAAEPTLEIPTPAESVAETAVELEDAVGNITRDWPDFELDDVLARDPFATEESLAALGNKDAEAVARLQEANVEPQEWPVSVYLESSKGPVAYANGQVLHEGDIVDEKWQVTSLSRQSIYLEPLQ